MASKSPLSASDASGDFAKWGLSTEDEDARLEVVAKIIHATWDIAPNPDGETPKPFVYWKTDKDNNAAGYGCASALIKRYVIFFMSYFMLVFSCPILLLTNMRWDMKKTTYLLISALAHANFF